MVYTKEAKVAKPSNRPLNAEVAEQRGESEVLE
jgi:hypothetical protein